MNKRLKKTLVTLAALTCVGAAVADVTLDTVVYKPTEWKTSNGVDTLTLSKTLVIGSDMNWTISGSMVVGTADIYTQNNDLWGLCPIASGSNPVATGYGSGFQLWVKSGKTNSGVDTNNTGVVLTKLNSNSETTLSEIGKLTGGDTLDFSISYSATDKLFTLTVASGEKTQTATSTYTGVPANITTLSSNLSKVDGWDLGNVTVTRSVVPEPATATLGLLALAGLAARRRRK